MKMRSFGGVYPAARLLAIALGLWLTSLPTPGRAQPLPYTGVNLAGGEFYDPKKIAEPVHGKNFIYPTKRQFDYFAGKGMNIFRIGFRWETLQPAPRQPFRQAEIDRLKAVVKLATEPGHVVILNPHNYARYFGKVVGGSEVGQDVFANFWTRLASEFRGNKKVWFGLVNEPHGMPTEQWLNAANAAIAAIRKTGADNLILVPGNGYTGAHSWLNNWYGTANGVAMLKIRDPRDNYVFEVHQYLDADSSGTKSEVVRPTIGSERLRAFTAWCRAHKKRAFLGEFAVPVSDAGEKAIRDMLSTMEQNRDVWIGFTWWAAGAWWGDYMFSLEPKNGQDRPQMAYLLPHLQGRKPETGSPQGTTK